MAGDVDIVERLRRAVSVGDYPFYYDDHGEMILHEDTMSEAADTITALRDENAKLRTIISESASAIGNRACISPTCTIGFMTGLPEEIGLVTTELRSRIEELERERDEVRETAKPDDHVWVKCPNGHGGIVHQHFDVCGCCPECGTVLVSADPPAIRALGKERT